MTSADDTTAVKVKDDAAVVKVRNMAGTADPAAGTGPADQSDGSLPADRNDGAGTADPVDTAWRIHQALSDWTGQVDAKASFVLSIESAALAVVVGLSGADHRFGQLRGFWAQLLFWSGVAVLVLALLAAVSVVAPRTRANQLRGEWRSNFIYFGHLRHWRPEELAAQLRRADPLPALTRQLVIMSEIAWQKHRKVQNSFVLAIAGAALIALAAVFR